MKHTLFLLALCLCGCAKLPPAPPASSSRDADAAFSRLSDEFISGYFAWRPQTATSLGFHEYDGKLPDFRRPLLDAERARLASFDQRLGSLDSTNLSPAAFYDYRILRGAIQRELFAFDQMKVYTRNPMTYSGVIDLSTYIKRDFAPLEDRVRSIVAILNQTPALFAAARENLDGTLPRPQVETAIDEANGAVDFLGKDLVDALKELRNDELRSQFTAADRRAMDEFRSFAAYLKDEKLPRANDSYALGRDKYVNLLRSGEMLSESPERLLAIGLAALQRQQQVFAQAANAVDPSRPPIEVFKAVQKEHPTEQSLIADTTNDLEKIRQFVLDHHIVGMPSAIRARVMETPQFLRATSFASMDTPGPFEPKATEAYYYVTPPEPDWPADQKEQWLTAENYYTTDIVSIHEAYPGHYVQYLCLIASPATKIEKIFGSYAFIEGWAHYAEQMMVDEGFGTTDSTPPTPEQRARAAKYRLAQADEALLRICRLCVSIKMHCQGMTVDEATKFFQENCYYEQKPAHQEAFRGAFDPEYLYYTLGKLEILKLREDYRKQEGPNFSLLKFHDELLRHGQPPVRLLREVLLKDPQSWESVL